MNNTILGRGMSPQARQADIDQSDREYILQRQLRRQAPPPTDDDIFADQQRERFQRLGYNSDW